MLRKILGKGDKKATTAKIAIWYAFSNMFVRGIAFISTPIFTRLLSKAEYGEFSNFTSWESILAVIVTLDFTASIARAKYDFDERMNEYLSSILLISNAVTLVTYIIVELNKAFFESFLSMDIIYIRLMFLYVMFLPAFNYLQAKHRIYRKYRFFVAFAISSALLRTGVAVLLVAILQNKILGRIIGYVVPTTIMYFILELYILRRGHTLDWKCVKYASIIAIPLIPHALSGIVLGSSDRIMITRIAGSEANALYTLAYQISLLANMLWTSMNYAWSPWLFDNIHADNKAAIRKNSKIYLGIFAALIIGVLLISPELMLVLGGQGYLEARYVMPPVIMGCVFQFVYGMYVNLEIYDKKTYLISIGTVCAAMMNVGLNSIFIPKYGYIAAAYTTLAGYAALFAFHYCIVKIKVRSLSSIYDFRFISLVLLTMLISCGLALPLYNTDRDQVRFLVLIIYVLLMCILAFKYRKKVIRLLGMKKRQVIKT